MAAGFSKWSRRAGTPVLCSRRKLKTAGPTPCRIRCETGPLLTAVDGFLEFGAGGKLCHLPGSDLDGGARLRVTPIAGLSLGNREGAKTNQRYPITFFQGRRYAVHGCVDCGSRLHLTDAATRCDTVNEIGFVH